MSCVTQAFMTPGLPQLIFESSGQGHWQTLRTALKQAAHRALATRPDVLIIYSTQWVSVLGHSFQFAANPRGLHVDENWHDLGDMPFDFKADRDLAMMAEQFAREAGLATRLVDYEGFPVDTGTLVTLKMFNPDSQIPVLIVSSNIYADQADSVKLGQAVRKALQQSGKRAVVVNCSQFSNRFLSEAVTPETDRLSPEADSWNRRMLDLLQTGKNAEAMALGPEFAQAAQADMGFKGFYWMMGLLDTPATPAEVLAYGPLWGTGAAVVAYDFSGQKG